MFVITEIYCTCFVCVLFTLQPENLLLDISNSVAQVKLTDFGDARHIYNNYYVHTTASDPEFLSPEIVAGTPVGLLSDIWCVWRDLHSFKR